MRSAAFLTTLPSPLIHLHSTQLNSDRLILGIQLPPTDLAHNYFRYLSEDALNILPSFSRTLHEMKPILLGTVKTLIVSDTPPS